MEFPHSFYLFWIDEFFRSENIFHRFFNEQFVFVCVNMRCYGYMVDTLLATIYCVDW